MSFNDLERGTGSNQGRSSPLRPGRPSSSGPLPLYHAPRSSAAYRDDDDERGFAASASSTGTATPSPEQVAEFKRLADSVGTQIFKINSNTAAIGKLVKLADARPPQRAAGSSGGREDRDWSKGAHDLVESTRIVIKSTTPTLKQLSNLVVSQQPNPSPQQKLHLAKLQRDFESALQSFSEAQKLSARKSKEELEGAKRVVRGQQTGKGVASSSSAGATQGRGQGQGQQLVQLEEEERQAGFEDDSVGPLSSGQQQQQVQQQKQQGPSLAELEFQESLIAERETSIREIESGIHELNEIFRDLGQIVQEQGGMIDNIEYNITEIATNTEGADRELVSANEYQRKAGRRAACLLLIVGFVVTVVLLAILS